MTAQRISAIMTNPSNEKLKAAYEHINKKYGEFPFEKEEYEPFVQDKLSETAAEGEEASDLQLLCDAWIADMVESETDIVFIEGMN